MVDLAVGHGLGGGAGGRVGGVVELFTGVGHPDVGLGGGVVLTVVAAEVARGAGGGASVAT